MWDWITISGGMNRQLRVNDHQPFHSQGQRHDNSRAVALFLIPLHKILDKGTGTMV